MGLFDSSSAPSLSGANDVPKPRSDSDRNAPPAETHQRVIDFVREAPAARYTFDSRVAARDGGDPVAELCRIRGDGGMSCVKLSMESAALFKSMQSLGFFCALPAEPTRTHMECTPIPIPK